MVTFDGKEYKPGLLTRLKNLFTKEENFNCKKVDPAMPDFAKQKLATIDISNVVEKPEPLYDLTKMALDREEFLKKKYHLIGSHNAMISALNDNVTFIKSQLELIRTRKSHLKVLSNYISTTVNHDAKKALDVLITSIEKEEKSCRNFITRNQAKIQNRSILIGDLTRAKNTSELVAAEKEYKSRSKQKPNKEK